MKTITKTITKTRFLSGMRTAMAPAAIVALMGACILAATACKPAKQAKVKSFSGKVGNKFVYIKDTLVPIDPSGASSGAVVSGPEGLGGALSQTIGICPEVAELDGALSDYMNPQYATRFVAYPPGSAEAIRLSDLIRALQEDKRTKRIARIYLDSTNEVLEEVQKKFFNGAIATGAAAAYGAGAFKAFGGMRYTTIAKLQKRALPDSGGWLRLARGRQATIDIEEIKKANKAARWADVKVLKVDQKTGEATRVAFKEYWFDPKTSKVRERLRYFNKNRLGRSLNPLQSAQDERIIKALSKNADVQQQIQVLKSAPVPVAPIANFADEGAETAKKALGTRFQLSKIKERLRNFSPRKAAAGRAAQVAQEGAESAKKVVPGWQRLLNGTGAVANKGWQACNANNWAKFACLATVAAGSVWTYNQVRKTQNPTGDLTPDELQNFDALINDPDFAAKVQAIAARMQRDNPLKSVEIVALKEILARPELRTTGVPCVSSSSSAAVQAMDELASDPQLGGTPEVQVMEESLETSAPADPAELGEQMPSDASGDGTEALPAEGVPAEGDATGEPSLEEVVQEISAADSAPAQ